MLLVGNPNGKTGPTLKTSPGIRAWAFFRQSRLAGNLTSNPTPLAMGKGRAELPTAPKRPSVRFHIGSLGGKVQILWVTVDRQVVRLI